MRVNWTRVVAELDNRSFTILYLSRKVGLGIRFELKDIEMRVLCCLLWVSAVLTAALPAFSDEVNVYSYRQPELVKPVFDAFTSATGIGVNVTYLNKGLIERLKSEGSRSPADLVFTVDIARLKAVVEAGVTQPVDSEILSGYTSNEFKDPENNWFALTLRGRVVYASKDRVKSGEVSTYEDLADPKWKGKICTRPGTHPYNLALFSAMIAHHGEDFTRNWLQAVKDNLARKPQGNDRAQVKAIWAGECDISLGNTYYMGKMLQDESQQVWANSSGSFSRYLNPAAPI